MADAVKEWVTGTVVASNDKGVKLEGDADYSNWSRYAEGEKVIPAKGTKVRLGLDKDGWIRAITDSNKNPLGGAGAASSGGGHQSMTKEDLRRITTLSCLRSACTLLGGLGMPEPVLDTEGKPKPTPAPTKLALATALRWAEEIAPELFRAETEGEGK